MLTAIIFSLLAYPAHAANPTPTITIAKQWHLAPGDKTTDIEKSRTLPQFRSQKDLYLKIRSLIESGQAKAVLMEGCEGEVSHGFTTAFNGWKLADLEARRTHRAFADILAPIPLKIEAALPDKAHTLCGDSLELVKKNSLAVSDLRAYAGYFMRLTEFKGKNDKKYQDYAESLLKPAKDRRPDEAPEAYARRKALESLERFQIIMKERNDSFLKVALAHQNESPVIVIGGLHAADLKEKLTRAGLKVETLTPDGYTDEEETLVARLKKMLN